MLPFIKPKNCRPKAINVIRKVTCNVYRAKLGTVRLYYRRRKAYGYPRFIFSSEILLK